MQTSRSSRHFIYDSHFGVQWDHVVGILAVVGNNVMRQTIIHYRPRAVERSLKARANR